MRVNGRRRIRRLFQDIRTIGGAVVVLAGVLAGVYSLWPIPKQVEANAEGIEEHHEEEYQPLRQDFDGFIIEQRAATAAQEKAAQMTQEVMMRLLDRMNEN